MMFVECTIVNLETRTPMSKYTKRFDMIDDFNKWYGLTKTDTSMIINIMSYDPMEKPLLKQINDVKLLSVSREIST